MLSRKSKRAILGFLLFGLFLLTAFIGLNQWFSYLERERRLQEERALLRQPEPFLLEVERGNLIRERRLTARADAWQQARVAAEASGQVVALDAEIGERLEAGQVFLRVDDRLVRADTEAARAALAAGEARLEDLRRRQREAEGLFAQSGISRSELEGVRRQVEAQEQEVERIRQQLARTRELLERHQVRAPFDGVVVRRMVDLGDQVTSGQPVIEFADLRRLRIVFHVSQQELDSVRPGEELTIRWSHRSSDPQTFVVKHVAPVASSTTGQYRVEGELANPDLEWPAGLAGLVRLVVSDFPDTPMVRTMAVRLSGENFVVERYLGEGESEIVEVEIGPEISGYYPVFSGVTVGDRLLVR